MNSRLGLFLGLFWLIPWLIPAHLSMELKGHVANIPIS